MPRVREVKGRNFSNFVQSSVDPAKVPFKHDPQREEERLQNLEGLLAKREEQRREREKRQKQETKLKEKRSLKKQKRTRSEKRQAKKCVCFVPVNPAPSPPFHKRGWELGFVDDPPSGTAPSAFLWLRRSTLDEWQELAFEGRRHFSAEPPP